MATPAAPDRVKIASHCTPWRGRSTTASGPYRLDELGWLQFQRLCDLLLEAHCGVRPERFSGEADRCRSQVALRPVCSSPESQPLPEPTLVAVMWSPPGAIRRLEGLAAQDTRTLSYTLMSAGQLVDAYRFEAAQRSERTGPRVTVADLLEANGTLFLLAPESRQDKVAPLFAALLGEVFRALEERTLLDGPLDPPARFVLDEAAHLAALSSLPERLSLTSGQGARIASLWQSHAQIRHRYREQADTVVASSHARVFLGPIADEATRKLIVDLLDDEPAQRHSRHAGPLGAGRRSKTIQETRERKASAQGLQQLERWHGLAITGSELPMVGRVRPYWQRPHVQHTLQPPSDPPRTP